jgi:peptidoglycan hydrolase-like protein with peptidoglycan-binding domain
MKPLRMNIAAIMNDNAPAASLVPGDDGAGRPTLRRNANGVSVRMVQVALGIAVTGTFDGLTEAAVRDFQRTNNLVPDGIVGPKTWSLLKA